MLPRSLPLVSPLRAAHGAGWTPWAHNLLMTSLPTVYRMKKRHRSRESGPYADKEAQRTAETFGVVLSWLAGEAA